MLLVRLFRLLMDLDSTGLQALTFSCCPRAQGLTRCKANGIGTHGTARAEVERCKAHMATAAKVMAAMTAMMEAMRIMMPAMVGATVTVPLSQYGPMVLALLQRL